MMANIYKRVKVDASCIWKSVRCTWYILTDVDELDLVRKLLNRVYKGLKNTWHSPRKKCE